MKARELLSRVIRGLLYICGVYILGCADESNTFVDSQNTLDASLRTHIDGRHDGSDVLALSHGQSTSAAQRTEKIRRVCTACHAFPEPGAFTDRTWNEAIRYKYWLFERFYPGRHGGLTEAEVLSYYRAHAAPFVPRPKMYSADDPRRPRFALRPFGEARAPSLIASIQSASAGASSLQVTDMLSGRIESFDLSQDAAVPDLVLNANHPTKSVQYDFNQDRRMDHLVFELSIFSPKDIAHGHVRLFLSEETGFTPHTLLSGVGRIADGSIGDVDGDGVVDAVIADFGWQKTGALILLRGLRMDGGQWIFEREELDRLAGHVGVELVDMDADGDLDIVDAVSQHHERIQLWTNDGRGDFSPTVIFQADTPLWGTLGVRVVDIDGDGDQDILHFNGDTLDAAKVARFQGVHWLRNDGAQRFTSLQLVELPGTHSIEVADFDGDGRLDIVAVANLSKSIGRTLWPSEKTPADTVQFESVVLLTQNVKGQFLPHSLVRNQSCFSAVHAVDRDGDGDQDLILGSFGMGWSLFGHESEDEGKGRRTQRVCDQDRLLWMENLGITGKDTLWMPADPVAPDALSREIQALTTITQNDPTNVTFRINLGNALTQIGRLSDANAVLQSAVEANPKEALTVFRDGCAAGTADACTNLGVLYFYGDGVKKDLSQSAGFYRKACDGGEGNACANLAMMYRSGNGVSQDIEQAISLLKKACEYGQVAACGQLGELHLRGEGVVLDTERAQRLLHQACVGGDTPSCQTLSGLSSSTVQPRTAGAEARVLEAGCADGKPGPCRVLADRYARGIGVVRDMARAIGYAEKACLSGDAAACGNAGGGYLDGTGVPKDLTKARALFQKACTGGVARACEFMNSLKTRP